MRAESYIIESKPNFRNRASISFILGCSTEPAFSHNAPKICENFDVFRLVEEPALPFSDNFPQACPKDTVLKWLD